MTSRPVEYNEGVTQAVAEYYHSQRHHDSKWLLIDAGMMSRRARTPCAASAADAASGAELRPRGEWDRGTYTLVIHRPDATVRLPIDLR